MRRGSGQSAMGGRAGPLLPVACCLLPLLAGCALRGDVVRLERLLLEQRAEAARADSTAAARMATLQRMLAALSDSVAAQQAALALLRGDVRMDLTNVQQQLVAIQELTGQSQQRLTDLRAELARRAEGPLPAAAPRQPAEAPPGEPSPGGARGPSAEELYDLSLQQLRRGSPGAARAGFAEFLRRFPDHPRAVDAVFFTGEAWGTVQQQDSAAAAYRTVAERWPASPRVPSAVYRIGLIALAAGRTAEAREAFDRLVRRHPDSDEAALARERLRTLPR